MNNRVLTLSICFELLERIFASPIAKKIANEKNINLGDLSGSGPNGRILKADVESYTPAGMLPFNNICFGIFDSWKRRFISGDQLTNAI